ncbi:acyl carrier protein, partial [Streptomyces mobaraensis]
AAGLSGLSVGWGLWETSGDGMTGGLGDTDVARMARIGVKAMSSEHGLALLDAAQRRAEPYVLAADLDPRVLAAKSATALPALLRAFANGQGPARPTAAGRPSTDWAGQLAGLTVEAQYQNLLDLVRTHAAAVLGHAGTDAVRADVPFTDLGFDSLTAVELRNRLSAATGLRLPATFIFRHPTPAAIAEELREQLCPAAADPSAPLFGELDRLETVIAGHAHDEDTRGRLVARLESLLWRLGDGAGDGSGDAVAGDDLESASDDELFELIDRELPS